ncbi:MAG: putative nucleic-acid-binding protein contains domain [Bryobacterales bacterium]|jgi:predicted nucleic acid-binding protein|nr:putative nucleic-acid-binding protein contains domain [Bryobacterales bacterium]
MQPCFVDTNILVYAIENTSDPREEASRSLLRNLLGTGAFRTSTQVLQELYVTETRKGKSKMTAAEVLEYVDSYALGPIVVPGYDDIRNAMMLSDSAQISYWDALIVITAGMAGCGTLYTEDLNHGQTINGVLIVNPFRPSAH